MHYDLLLPFLVLWEGVLSARSFIYQPDVSEHCRRRALPSIFLGKRVLQTNAQMMHFSRLELPYTCFIAIRAETGNHIILVIHLGSEDGLMSSCRDEGDQLLVYEMGETFGGYWGQVPAEPIWRRTAAETAPAHTTPRKRYTLKTAKRSTKTTTTTTEPSSTSKSTSKQLLLRHKKVQQQVWTDVVPLLNLSLHIVPSDVKVQPTVNSDDAFDAFYDVTPVPGVEYETSIVPLLQFSVSALKDARRDGGGGVEDERAPLFDLIYSSDDEFTTETSSTPHDFRKILRKHKSTTRADFFLRTISRFHESRGVLKSTTGSSSSQSLQRSSTLGNKFQYNQNQLSSIDLSTEAMGRNESTTLDSWLYVLDLMNIFKNGTNISYVESTETNDEQSILLRKISKMEHDRSIYLESDLANYINGSESTKLNTTSSKQISVPSPIIPKIISSTENYSISKDGEINNNSQPTFLNDSFTDMTRIINVMETLNETRSSVVEKKVSDISMFQSTSKFMSAVTTEPSSGQTILIKPMTGALVGHESWENVVNVAPKMEMALNNFNVSPKYDRLIKSTPRVKRDVHAIDVDSKPHAMVQRYQTTKVSLHSDTDMYGFPPMVEPRDDEIYGRVHLRYLRRFVGPAIFNLCNYTRNEPKLRQVLLFNSSRILIGISNFTIKRMTLVATSARTLESVLERCPPYHLECQVSGARVCIDSSSACDGVPNCGADDIYDEDRLTCGSHGVQHNVYLAAFTFLAVLMTICYSVHYWLKRCVPKVSEAFFVYTNGAENILYLDSIMKSPTDTDDSAKMIYHGPILEEDYYLEKSNDRRSTIKKLLDRISVFFQKEPEISPDNLKRESRYDSRKMYSFTESELKKFSFKTTAEMSMQTEPSMEMQPLQRQSQPKSSNLTNDPIEVNPLSFRVEQERDSITALPEVPSTTENRTDLRAIKLLKHFRDARSSSQESPRVGFAEAVAGSPGSGSDERELGNLLYDLHGFPKASTSSLVTANKDSMATASTQLHAEPTARMSNTGKRLRFEETATVIPSPHGATDSPGQSSKSLLPPGGPVQPSDEGSGMDFIRFWNLKPKKSKIKSHVSLK